MHSGIILFFVLISLFAVLVYCALIAASRADDDMGYD